MSSQSEPALRFRSPALLTRALQAGLSSNLSVVAVAAAQYASALLDLEGIFSALSASERVAIDAQLIAAPPAPPLAPFLRKAFPRAVTAAENYSRVIECGADVFPHRTADLAKCKTDSARRDILSAELLKEFVVSIGIISLAPTQAAVSAKPPVTYAKVASDSYEAPVPNKQSTEIADQSIDTVDKSATLHSDSTESAPQMMMAPPQFFPSFVPGMPPGMYVPVNNTPFGPWIPPPYWTEQMMYQPMPVAYIPLPSPMLPLESSRAEPPIAWVCSCGHTNPQNFRKCNSCKAFTPRPTTEVGAQTAPSLAADQLVPITESPLMSELSNISVSSAKTSASTSLTSSPNQKTSVTPVAQSEIAVLPPISAPSSAPSSALSSASASVSTSPSTTTPSTAASASVKTSKPKSAASIPPTKSSSDQKSKVTEWTTVRHHAMSPARPVGAARSSSTSRTVASSTATLPAPVTPAACTQPVVTTRVDSAPDESEEIDAALIEQREKELAEKAAASKALAAAKKQRKAQLKADKEKHEEKTQKTAPSQSKTSADSGTTNDLSDFKRMADLTQQKRKEIRDEHERVLQEISTVYWQLDDLESDMRPRYDCILKLEERIDELTSMCDPIQFSVKTSNHELPEYDELKRQLDLAANSFWKDLTQGCSRINSRHQLLLAESRVQSAKSAKSCEDFTKLQRRHSIKNAVLEMRKQNFWEEESMRTDLHRLRSNLLDEIYLRLTPLHWTMQSHRLIELRRQIRHTESVQQQMKAAPVQSESSLRIQETVVAKLDMYRSELRERSAAFQANMKTLQGQRLVHAAKPKPVPNPRLSMSIDSMATEFSAAVSTTQVAVTDGI